MQTLRKAISALSVIAILSSLVVSTAFAYSDVPAGEYYSEAVESFSASGVLDATKETFELGKVLNRAEAAQLIVNAAGLTADVPDEPMFDDVPVGQWYFDNIAIAYQNGVVNGYTDADGELTGLYGPGDELTRSQFAKMVVEAFDLAMDEEPTSTQFDDVTGWEIPYVETARYYGVVNGYDSNTFGPNDKVRKEDAVVMAYRATTAEPGAGDTGDDDDDDDVVGGDLEVSLGDTPDATTLPDGTAFNELTVLDFEAGSEDVEVDEITVTRSGLMSDSYVKVSVWVDGVRYGNVISVSENQATVTMNNPIEVNAGETVEVVLAANIDALAGSGTLALGIESADDIDINGGDIEGNFPLTGEIFGVTDGSSSVAAATMDLVSLASTTRNVDVGQEDYEITRFKISETSSKEALYVDSLVLFNNGSSGDEDLENITVKDQNGEVLGTVESAKGKVVTVEFDEQYEVPKGTTRYFYVYVDVVSGSTRTAQYIIQNDFDLMLEGKSTGAKILATADAASSTDTSFPIGDISSTASGYNHITINEGSLALTKDNSSPSGDVTLGASDVVLGTFQLQAQGEDVELQRIALDFSNGSDQTRVSNTTSYFDYVTASSAQTDLVGSVKVQTSSGKTLYTVSAHTAALWNNSPAYATLSAYHTVKAGTTETLKIVGSVNSSSTYTGSGEQVKAGINKVYYYKKNSLKYADTSAASANTLSVTTSSLSVSKDTSYGDQEIVTGTSGVKVGQFNVKASAAEGVNITSIGLQVDNENDDSDTGVSNLKIYKGTDNTGTQLGSTQTSVADETAMTVSVSNFGLDAGEEVILSVYADISSVFADTTDYAEVILSTNGISGTGKTSQSAASGPSSPLTLQRINMNSAGALTITNADDNPESAILVSGTAGTETAKFKLSASQAEDLYLKRLTLRVDTNTDEAAVASAVLYGSSASNLMGDEIGSLHSLQSDTATRAGYITWTWSGDDRPMIDSNSSYYVTVAANLVSSSQTAITGKTPKIILADIDVEGTSQLALSGAGSDLVSTNVAVGTFAADATALNLGLGGIDATATTMLVDDAGAAGAGVDFTTFTGDTGYYCLIDQDDDATLDDGEEIVYVMEQNGTTGTYEVERGVFGTTPALAAAGDDVYCVAAKAGNAHTVLNTKVTIAADTTGLDTSAKASMKLAKFVVTAAQNSADPAENKATLQKVRVTMTATNAHAGNVYLYPSEKEDNATYRVTGAYVASNVVEFDLTANSSLVSSAYDDIVEGFSRTYIIKADTVTGTNGSIDVQISQLGTDAITSTLYGDSADVLWTDGTNGSAWVDQDGTSLNLRYVSWSSATGTPDTVVPTVTSVTAADAGTVDANDLNTGDTLAILFDSSMSPVNLTNVVYTAATALITATVGGVDTVSLFKVDDGVVDTGDCTEGTVDLTEAWSVSNTTLTFTWGTCTSDTDDDTWTGDDAIIYGDQFRDIYGNALATDGTLTLAGEF